VFQNRHSRVISRHTVMQIYVFFYVNHRKTVGENIRAARKSCGWSQEKLAIRAKMNKDYLSTLELGQVNVSLDMLIKISKALKVPFSELVKGI
jgi:ribosome-binding protein aMBF1 (putative translation factor)